MKVQVVDGATTTTLATYSNVGTNATYTQKSFNVWRLQGQDGHGEVPHERGLLAADVSFVVDDTSLATS